MTALPAAALSRALAERDGYRLTLYAALDQLHAAQKREQRLREQLADERQERERFVRAVLEPKQLCGVDWWMQGGRA